jgi:hypothetical protein
MNVAAGNSAKQLRTDQSREMEEHGLRAELREMIACRARKSCSIPLVDPRNRNGKLATAGFRTAFPVGDDAEVEPQRRGNSRRFGECTPARGQNHS